MGFPDLMRAENGDILKKDDKFVMPLNLTGIDEWSVQQGGNGGCVAANIKKAAKANEITVDEVQERLRRGEIVSY